MVISSSVRAKPRLRTSASCWRIRTGSTIVCGVTARRSASTADCTGCGASARSTFPTPVACIGSRLPVVLTSGRRRCRGCATALRQRDLTAEPRRAGDQLDRDRDRAVRGCGGPGRARGDGSRDAGPHPAALGALLVAQEDVAVVDDPLEAVHRRTRRGAVVHHLGAAALGGVEQGAVGRDDRLEAEPRDQDPEGPGRAAARAAEALEAQPRRGTPGLRPRPLRRVEQRDRSAQVQLGVGSEPVDEACTSKRPCSSSRCTESRPACSRCSSSAQASRPRERATRTTWESAPRRLSSDAIATSAVTPMPPASRTYSGRP